MARTVFDLFGGQSRNAPPIPQPQAVRPPFQNPAQKANYILQAMRNPAGFVKEQFPDVPEAIQNDPNAILQYLQRTRNISNQQIQGILGMLPRR